MRNSNSKHYQNKDNMFSGNNVQQYETMNFLYTVINNNFKKLKTFVEGNILENSEIVYIASNHASHFDYAKYFIQKNKSVFVEKPICLTKKQLSFLNSELHRSKVNFYAGYNRPLSPAIRNLAKPFVGEKGPFTYSACIIGHLLGPSHWYRESGEGSEIVSNLGHWIDLYCHFLLKKDKIPNELRLALVNADKDDFSDNFQITITSDLGDLAVLTFSCRGEPLKV